MNMTRRHRKRKTVVAEDCPEIFSSFLDKRLEYCKTNSFTFVPIDVLDYENMHEKQYSTDILQSECKTMGVYISKLQDKDVVINNTEIHISLYRLKNRSQKVYRLELINNETTEKID